MNKEELLDFIKLKQFTAGQDKTAYIRVEVLVDYIKAQGEGVPRMPAKE